MASSNEIGTKLVYAACKKFPTVPSRTLARKLFDENPGVWNKLQSCRGAISRRRGRWKIKEASRCGVAEVLPSSSPTVPFNPLSLLPPSDEKPFTPVRLHFDRDTRVLALSDIHIPFHNTKALTAAINEGVRRDCKVVFLNGDTLDFYQLSRFQKDPRQRSAKQEIERCKQLLDYIDERFPKALKIWKDGNHDEHYERYLMCNAPALFDVVMEKASLPRVLGLKRRGWKYTTGKRPVMLGHLPVLHGHEYPTPVIGPVNAARGLFIRSHDSCLVGHHHHTSEHTARTVNGKIITTWSTGCLCGLHPAYAVFNRWNHGAAEIEVAKDDTFAVRNFRIDDGKLLN